MTRFLQLAKLADEPTRRSFLSGVAKGLLGVSLVPSMAQLAAGSPGGAQGMIAGVPRRVPTAKKVIHLFMSGGMSHLDTFDVKPGSDIQGATQAIHTPVDGIQVAAGLSRTAQLMEHIALVRGMHSTQGAHEQGRYLMLTSYDRRGTTVHPAMSSWVSHASGRINPRLPASVLIGGGSNHPGSGWMESAHGPVQVRDPAKGLQHSTLPKGVDGERFQQRLSLADQLNRSFQRKYDHKKVRAYSDLYHEAINLMNSEDLAAFDIGQESEALHAAYGQDRFGQGCLLARRLVEHDVRYVEVNMGGWDTHQDNFTQVEDNLVNLDRALSTLIADCFQRGILDETLIVLATEFGRSPRINERQGRDHFPKAFTCLMAGGGIRGGQAWGRTDERGASVIENPVGIPDFNATIAYAMGIDVDEVVTSPDGRPFTVAHRGRPVIGLFA